MALRRYIVEQLDITEVGYNFMNKPNSRGRDETRRSLARLSPNASPSPSPSASLKFRLLGPVEAWRGTQRIHLGGWRQQSVLAALALRAGRSATIAELAAAVWDDFPPLTSKQQIHSAVSALRNALGGQILARHTAGYLLGVQPDRVDALLFGVLINQSRKAAADGDLALAVSRSREALGLWRGPALAGLAGLSAQAVRLEEQRMLALEERIAAELQLGRHRDLIPELSELAAEQPTREQFIGQFMVALTRCGRASEALELYQQTRRRLASETGMDVGPELRRLELSVLRGDFDPGATLDRPLQVQEPERNVPTQLPLNLKSLVGRADTLAQLVTLASDQARSARPPAILITGSPGIGKTVLAVAAAHRLGSEFPDGQLYADLRGFSPGDQARPPANALGFFLNALGVPPDQVPSGLPAMAGLFRRSLASRRMVVVLDNARDADQVRALMPGTPGCVTIVSSRDQMSSLIADQPMRFFRLDPLPDPQARDLLASRLGSDRIAAEPEAVDGIVKSCAGLPLALVSVVARALTHPSFPLRALADELLCQQGRIDMLSRGEQATSVRAAFSISYRLLSAAAARMFRLVGLHCGPEISVPAAASLSGAALSQARLLLAELDAANLVTEHRPGRFRQHDLLRAYSADLAEETESPADRRAATVRLLDYYLHSSAAAARMLSGENWPAMPGHLAPGVCQVEFCGREDAMAWFTAEYQILVAVNSRLEADGDGSRVGGLSGALATFLKQLRCESVFRIDSE